MTHSNQAIENGNVVSCFHTYTVISDLLKLTPDDLPLSVFQNCLLRANTYKAVALSVARLCNLPSGCSQLRYLLEDNSDDDLTVK